MATYSTDEIFQALADPTRRAVLDMLKSGDCAAGVIAQAFPVSRPAISKHLRQLRRAGLVAETRSGRHRLYRLNAKPLQNVAAWLAAYHAHWRSKLESLKAYVESTEAVTTPRCARDAAETNHRKPRQRRGATR